MFKKTLFLAIFLCLIFGLVIIKILNSDWYLNKTIAIKEGRDYISCTKAKYKSEYKNNQLKINFNFSNVNNRAIEPAKNLIKDNQELIKVQLLDKNSDAIFEIPIFFNDLKPSENNEYDVIKTVSVDKNTLKKAKYVTFAYKIPICINNSQQKSLSDKKTLILYYSNGGNTKAVADVMKQILKCDIKEIRSDEAYKQKNILALKNLVQEQILSGYIPKTNKIDISDYDVIFIGSPVWKSHVSLPVKSFLENNDFKNKTIIPFYTFGGKADKQQLDNEIKEFSKNADVLNSFLTMWNGVAFLQYQLFGWLNEIYL